MAVNYNKHVVRFGVGGLDVRRSVDLIDTLNACVLTNAIRLPDGGWTSRFGQTALATSSSQPLHSAVRGIDPQSGTTRFLWGSGTALFSGPSGALSSIATGFSGNPLSLVPWEAAQSGQAWVVVGDSTKMVKVRVSDGLVLPIGLPEPSAAPTTALASEHKKTVETFSGSSAASWTPHAGTGGNPVLTDVTFKATANSCVNFLAQPGAATGGYYDFADKALNLDLSTFGGGVDASDNDYFHLWLRADNPQQVDEIRIYFTTGTFTAGYVPGNDATYNLNGFYKAFRASDTTKILAGASTTAVAPTIVTNALVDDAVKAPQTYNGSDPATDIQITTVDGTSTTQTPSSAQVAGANAWTEWGTVGIPLRRGDFQPIGESPDWSAVKGITIYVSKVAPAGALNVQFYDLYLTGGAGPDTGEPGTQKYDYVYTNYDPRTGAEGNASESHLQADTAWLDALRRGITITPAAGSDSAWRQRIYRRGGTLTDNWRFVGVNTSNGGAFTDTKSDAEIATEDVAPTDYFQAVPSVDSSGASVLAKAVPYVWGPLQNLIFAAGDPNRPGAVYYPYPGSVDQWGANGYAQVASSTESMQGGFVLGSQAFAWSTQRLYALNINLSDSQAVTSTVTGCTRAPIAPWAHVTGAGANWFVASDGVYATDGGIEQSISDAWVRPLFQGQSAYGYKPVDYTQTTAIRLALYQNELHIFYKDTDGASQSLVYHVLDKLWRHANYANGVTCPFADTTTGVSRFLFGTSTGAVLTYAGTSDTGSEIGVTIRTGAANNGYPKSYKRYSDFTVDIDCNGQDVSVTGLSDYNATAQPSLYLSGQTGRQPSIYSFTTPLLSLTLGAQVFWSTTSAPPTVYGLTTTFEVEPPTITRWSSLPTDHGAPGWQMVTGMYLALRSNATVTLTVTAYGQDGTILNTSTYTKPSTGFAKVKDWIPFNATKGAFYSYVLSSDDPFVLYPEETTVFLSLWGGETTQFTPLIGISREGTTSFTAFTPDAAQTAGG